MGAELYHPDRGIIITRADSADFKAVMMNQASIFNLIKSQCGTK